MTGSVNFNPFVKNIQIVDLEQYEEIVEQQQSQGFGINGDSQDEDVQIRLMSAETERNYKAAKKHGMREEIPNNITALKKELEKYIEVFSQNYSRQHPNVSPNFVERFLDGIDNEFLARYMQEVQGDRTIVMSDAVQEFEIYAKQKAEQFDRGAQAVRNIISAEKHGSEEKYADLYNTVKDAQSLFSKYGSIISSSEADSIRDSASEYIVNQLLKDNVDLLNQINPSFENYYYFREAKKVLDEVKDMRNPREAKNAIEEAKNLIKELLKYTSTYKIANTISNNPPGGRHSVSSMMLDSASDVKDQYGDLYAAAKKASSLFSIGGRHVTNKEEIDLKRKTADLVVSQLLNDQISNGLLKALIPDYKTRPEYHQAMKILAGIEYETNPAKVNQRLNDAKNEIMQLLRHTDGEDIANVVKFSAYMDPHPGMHGPHKGHGPEWHEFFQDRFEVSRNQHRLFNAAQDIGFPQGRYYDAKDSWGTPRGSAVYSVTDTLRNYTNDLKKELAHSVYSHHDRSQIFRAIDMALRNFDADKYIRNHGDIIDYKELCQDFLRGIQHTMAIQNRIGDFHDQGDDPFNKNLMDSKYLVAHSGSHIDKYEKSVISKTYAKYLIQALISNPNNVNLLASLGHRNYFDKSSFSNVSVQKVMQELKNLLQHPPLSQRQFEQKMNEITKDLEFLVNQMNTRVLADQIMHQGAQW